MYEEWDSEISDYIVVGIRPRMLDTVIFEDGKNTLSLHGSYCGYGNIRSPFVWNSIKTTYWGRYIDVIEEDPYFYYNNLTPLLPSSICHLTIGRFVEEFDFGFCFYRNNDLESIKINNLTPPNVYNGSFSSLEYKMVTLYIPKGSTNIYSQHPIWGKFQIVEEFDYQKNDIEEDNDSLNIQIDDVVSQYQSSFLPQCSSVSYTRTFNNTNLQALYVPFSMTYSDWSEDFDIYSINGFFEYDTDDDGVKDKAVLELMKVKEGSGDLKPNYPYVIKAKEAGEKTITLTDATLYATEINSIDCSTVETKYTFTGTYSRMNDMKSAGYYALAGGELCPAEDDYVTLGAFRWYMSVQDRGSQLIPRNSSIKIRIYGEDDAASRIEGVEYVDSADDAIYTIDGRLVKSNTLRPGLYIKNGKKFFVNK